MPSKIPKTTLSQTQLGIITKLKDDWYLEHDLLERMWKLKHEMSGQAERVNRNSVNLLLEKKIIHKVSTVNEIYNHCDIYVINSDVRP